jgi:hypothetical protein
MRKTNHAAKTCPAGPVQCEQIILIYPTQINKVKKNETYWLKETI